ncbi:GNAT family N-acetyltransferase [Halorubellus sp. JP-L1]|uniref:GNAT family N-acetyltransferase n=1 Tax=Halorubellus sp. JP-L1 TaxID=2715753 RepID=UPI00140CD9F7|nr:GNAT family N-acetyltransferase [Halorubellus sp. JP-L1]NHN40557.1 GNAT family N-acetyltransferase [Halorubellus sp. JP-L1]
MRVERAQTADLTALVDAWVALAAEQRQHGSHLHAAANRDRIRESMAHHLVEDTCLVARPGSGDVLASGSGDDAEDGASLPDVVGFVTFAVDPDGYEMDVDRGAVENLYVASEWRGRGVGARLLSAAEAELAFRGVEAVSLQVLAANDRARSFYEREGYGDHRVVVEKRLDVETDTKGNDGE